MSKLRLIGKILLAIALCFAVIRIAMRFSQDDRLAVHHVWDDIIMARSYPERPNFGHIGANDTRKMEDMLT